MNVLMIGLDPYLLDLSNVAATADDIAKGAQQAIEELCKSDHLVQGCWIDTGETAEAVVTEALTSGQWDVVAIGAGLRAIPEHLVLFEKLVNLGHKLAPSARFAFNSQPEDTASAVERQKHS